MGTQVHICALWSVQHISPVHKNKLIMTHHWKTQYCASATADLKLTQSMNKHTYIDNTT